MGKIKIQGGTPVGSASMCDKCSYAHIMTGYRESELIVLCDYPNRPVVVPFKLSNCSNYCDKNRPDWDQMEKLALPIRETSTSKPAGFRRIVLPSQLRKEEELEDDDVLDPVIVND